MSSLNGTEKGKFERLLSKTPGYVLDFSDRTFKEFVADSTGLNIYEQRYNYGSGSKLNRLRGFWNTAPDDRVGKLLGDLLDHGVETGAFTTEDQPTLNACRQIVRRLLPQSSESPQPSHSGLNTQIVNNFYASVGNVAQNSHGFNQTTSINGIPLENIARLVTELTTRLDELDLDTGQKQLARAQIATLQAELQGDPDPTIVKEAGRTLRNLTEGAISSLIASAVQPGVWHFVSQMLSQLSAP